MVNLEKWISTMTEGIPFSSMRKQVSGKIKQTKKKRTKKKRTKKRSRKRFAGSSRKHKRTNMKRMSIPPKGVIIRRGSKLYRSTGTKMKLFTQ